MISGGAYGDVYIFPGHEDGTFGVREYILDRNGEKINVGTTSAPHAVDWDRDGDLDLLVGNRTGNVFLFLNESGGTALRLQSGERLRDTNRVIKAANPGESGPHVTDWDGDGNHDLLLGGGNGSVLLYLNTADEGIPVLAPPVELVPKSGAFSRDMTHYDPSSDRGGHAKVHVTDWNGDGRQDLLVGIMQPESEEGFELTPDQEREKERLDQQYYEVFREYSTMRDRATERVLQMMGIPDLSNLPPARAEEYIVKLREEIRKEPDYADVKGRLDAVQEKRIQYYPATYIHGWVWVYLRK